MFAYIVRRLALMLVTLFGISVIIFVLLRVVPGNIVDILFDAAGFVDPSREGQPREGARPRPADRRAVSEMDRRAAAGRPRLLLRVREARAARRFCRGFRSPRGWPALALLFSASIGIPLGVISAVQQGIAARLCLRVVSLSGLSLPSFWLGLLILMASVTLFGIDADLQSEPGDLDRGVRDLLPSRRWRSAFAAPR